MPRSDDDPATVQDVHDTALAMPDVELGTSFGTPAYRVAKRPFVRWREPRADAVDEATGDRLTDVMVLWVDGEADKHALVEDPSTPFFTLPHYDDHHSVLLRECALGRLTRGEIREVVQDAWLAQAPVTRRRAWLQANGLGEDVGD
jgi:hypothetical protein